LKIMLSHLLNCAVGGPRFDHAEEPMGAFPFHALLRRLLVTAALPLGLMVVGAMPAYATVVTVTGLPGANGAPGKPGGAGGPATATATSSVPSNSAIATGGNGGNGGSGSEYSPPFYPPGAGGPGGWATSSATALNTTGSASATAISTGGNGGRGGIPTVCIHSCIPGKPGGGGVASATSFATGGGAGTVDSSAVAYGGAGGVRGPNPGLFGSASASASAQKSNVEVVTTAFSPGGGAASAFTNATVGGSIASVNLTTGRVVSNAILIPGDFGAGAMSAALSGQPQYEATAVFDFTTSKSETLHLTLPSDNFVGTGFVVTLEIFANATNSSPTFSYTFSNLTGLGGVESFFASHPLLLLGVGGHSIKLEYLLNYSSGAPYSSGYGFDFTYDFASSAVATAFDFPVSKSSIIPEPSTWAMMLLGFGGLGYAGLRRSYGLARAA
jgi:hypothetical protein